MKSILLTLLCAAVLFGQESVSRIVKLKHVNPDSLFSVLGVLAGKQVRWQPDAKMRIIALNGPASNLDALEEAIHRLDVPQPVEKNVELTFHMMLGSAQAESISVPPDLGDVPFSPAVTATDFTFISYGAVSASFELVGTSPLASNCRPSRPRSTDVSKTRTDLSQIGRAHV